MIDIDTVTIAIPLVGITALIIIIACVRYLAIEVATHDDMANHSIPSIELPRSHAYALPENHDEAFLIIRNASSWEEIGDYFTKNGFALIEITGDICAVEKDTGRSFLFSDSGHFISFIIERLGDPPPHILS